MKTFATLALLLCLYSLPTQARVELSPLFTDNMVLQQQTDAPVWGKAKPSQTVSVQPSWTTQAYTAAANEQGLWKLSIPTPVAGGPYTLTFSDGDKKLTLRNVMVGEVWLCSGQSNMEMPLAGWGKIDNYEQEVANAKYPNIRLLHVAKEASVAPKAEIRGEYGGWQVCSPATISEFSSTAYFFGRDLFQNLNVPIGLINSSWGGTPAEAWTSAESLEAMPDFREYLSTVKGRSAEEIAQEYRKNLDAWNAMVALADSSAVGGAPLFAKPDFNDAAWQSMSLPCPWESCGLPGFDGIVWFRYTVDVPAELAGKDLLLNLAEVDDDDITYFNGVQVGKTEGYNVQRKYKIPAKLVKRGKNVIAVKVMDTSGGGGLWGNAAQFNLSAFSGKKLAAISLAASWKYKVVIDFSSFPKRPQSPNNASSPSTLYNGMIHPLVPFAIKGAIWYQGEANASRAKQYRDLFPLMVQDWRKQWNADFPFYFAQLTSYDTPEPSEDWPMLREAQLRAMHLSNTGMAVTIDIGNPKDIHPKNKQDVGIRLSLLARAGAYGQQIANSGPIYNDYKVEMNAVRISFSHADGGLRSKGSAQPNGFVIAGPDHKFYPANATIEGNEVVVSSPQVAFPVAVRYAWTNSPEDANLCNAAGLPASPFRTDDF